MPEILDWRRVADPRAVARRAAEVRDWAPGMGPLLLECGEVCPERRLRLRSPAHAAILATLNATAGPVVLAPAPGPADGADHVARPGAVSDEALRRQAACLVVFVCTGNTCRSPLAEGLCKARLAERLGCTAADLPARGFHVLSAGMAATAGGPAADEAVAAARAYGADLTTHRSRPLTPDLAAQADYLIAMTRGHLLTLAEHFRGLASRPRLLDPAGGDLPDPIGCPPNVYEECARQIWGFLGPLVEELHPPASNAPPNA